MRSIALALMLAGCSCESPGIVGEMDAGRDGAISDPDAGNPDIPGLRALRIDPGEATIVDDGADPGETTSYRAIGTFDDGDRDVTDMVAWSVVDDNLGAVARGVFTSRGIGGQSQIVARASDLEAQADIIVVLEPGPVIVGDAPADAPTLFPDDISGDSTMGPDAMRVIYPSHETMFPRNLERVDHQWNGGAALDLFEVRFDSDFAHLRFYTTSRNFLPALADWRWLAETHAGRSLTFTVRGLERAAPATIHRSQDVTLYYSPSEVIGALYYWSTGAEGVMRATISSASATKFYTDPNGSDPNQCVSCHTVSRDGRRLFVNYGGENLHIATIPDREVRAPVDGQEVPGGWATFNPGATRLLWANRGLLRLMDVESGEDLGPVQLPAMRFATTPDWSPDGRYVAVAYGNRAPGNKNAQGTGLARLPVNADGTFGEPEILVASTADDDTIVFPSYSPDSRWIAFARMTGGSKDNETATIYLVAADGGEPIPLVRMNQRVRDEDGILDIGNNMPTWAPSTRPDIFWLAFSSLRAYGNVIPAGGRDQLWGVAIDTSLIGTSDASYAAFWMPFQDAAEGNHRAFWALNADDTCPSTVELCDSLDNDCDGIVDEMCCTPEEEQCGNGVDDDCDGAADEGCGCSPVENCTNGLDDDCDDLIDDQDEDCIII